MEWINRLFKYECPLCNGDGGELDIITDDGAGPFYECNWCDGNCEVGIYNYLIAKYEWWGLWEFFYKITHWRQNE